MEPVEPRPTAQLQKNNQLSVTITDNPVVSVARASISDLRKNSGQINKKVAARAEAPGSLESYLMRKGIKSVPPSGPVPIDIFLRMPLEEMLNHRETLKMMPFDPNELNKLPIPTLIALVPSMTDIQYNTVFHKIERNIYPELATFPLISQLFYIRYARLIFTTNHLRIVSNTFLALIHENRNPNLDKESIECIHEMLKLRIFAAMTKDEAETFPREVWEIIAAYAPAEIGKNWQAFFGDLLLAMPLDLLEKIAPMLNVDSIKAIDPRLQLLELRVSTLINPETEIPNIVAFLSKASGKFSNGMSLVNPGQPQLELKAAELPPLPLNLLTLIDAYLNHEKVSKTEIDRVSIKEIEKRLDPGWLKYFETLNTKIASSKVLDKRWTFYDRHKGIPLQLFVILFKKIKEQALVENLEMQIPKKDQLLWVCHNIDRLLTPLGSIAAEKREALDALIETIEKDIGNHEILSDIIPSTRIGPFTSKEIWNIFKSKNVHLKIKKLALSSKKIKHIPPEIWEMTNLTELRINGCPIISVSSEIKNLKNLARLDLGYNQLKSLPNEIFQIKSLHSLTIQRNPLVVSEAIFRMAQLKSFDCSNCQLLAIPDTTYLPEIVVLRAFGCGITRLSPKLFDSVKLLRLHLQGNPFRIIPKEIGKLSNLHTLFFGNCQIEQLPVEMKNLITLHDLELGGNRLEEIPPWIGEFKELTTLDFSYNQIASIPIELKQLVKLSTLSLSHNHLDTFPPLNLPASLKDLNLSGNQITEIPSDIIRLSSLNILSIMENELTDLPPLPIRLKYLFIQRNWLIKFPVHLFHHPISLTVHIDGNNIPPFVSPSATLTIHGRDNQIGKEKLT